MLVLSDRLGSDVCQEEEQHVWAYRRSFRLRRKSFLVCAISASLGRGGKTWKKHIQRVRDAAGRDKWLTPQLKKGIQQAEHKGSTYCSNRSAFPWSLTETKGRLLSLMASVQPKVESPSRHISAENGKSRRFGKSNVSPLRTAVQRSTFAFTFTEEQTPIKLHRPENLQPWADGVGF